MSKKHYSDSDNTDYDDIILEKNHKINLKNIIPINKTLKTNDIKNIMFEKINDHYSYGKYGDFKVIIMNKNGFINGTKLCKDGNKQFKNWIRNSDSKKSISDTAKELGLDADDMLILIKGGQNALIRGTYVHYELVTEIAFWTNKKFKIMC